MTAYSIEKFARAFHYSTEANKVDAAIQTEEAIDAEEGYSGASRSDDALWQ